MSQILHNGVPTKGEYARYVRSNDFKKIEKYSDDFINEVGEEINSYNKRWVSDPLHQWSRQWEYPFVIDAITKLRQKNLSVLDLGAGMTFLPYYLKDNLRASHVKALDYDRSLTDLYQKVNKIRGQDIDFSYQDIRELGKKSREQYDVIYSVSVLEHTNNYESILKSCHKLLRPGGMLCLTFDISLDSRDDIPLSEAKKLVASVGKIFSAKDLDKYLHIDREGVVISNQVAKLDKRLMPWRYPVVNIIKPIIKGRGAGHPYKRLTFCCMTVKKKNK